MNSCELVKIKVNNRIIEARTGELLSDILQNAGYNIPHICGGNGACGKCRVTVGGEEVLSCRYRVCGDIDVKLAESGEISSITGLSEASEMTENMCFALDIGTTALALSLVSVDKKAVVKNITKLNPQARFGADIMSRIKYAAEGGRERLRELLVDEIEKMVASFGVGRDLKMLAVGNVTMLHIFFGEDCRGLGTAPYTPIFLGGRSEPSFVSGVSEIEALPSIHAFFGADAVAGMHSIGFPEGGGYNLLLDLGTNAEAVLFSRDKILCTSAAAGPCFEGADIECGMSAFDGAVSAARVSEDGRIALETVGESEPVGICGSGLVDIIAVLLKLGVIDGTGYMEQGKYFLSDSVYLSAADVRAFQLAKSAIRSALTCLLQSAGATLDDIKRLYISGGFSAGINPMNAAAVGLLPRELAAKSTPAYNSALSGAVKYAIEPIKLDVYTRGAKYIDLSQDADFAELFVENMKF